MRRGPPFKTGARVRLKIAPRRVGTVELDANRQHVRVKWDHDSEPEILERRELEALEANETNERRRE